MTRSLGKRSGDDDARRPVAPTRNRSRSTSRYQHTSLQRALSKLGLASRREAEEWIRAGRVSVDGRVVTDPEHLVVPERMELALDGSPRARTERVVVAFHKPRGTLVTRRDPKGRPTVYDLLAELPCRVEAVGRLDQASSGLLLLTNDTRLADWLCDPKNAIPRLYAVTVRGEVTDETLARVQRGIIDRGERLSARQASVRKRSRRESHLLVELVEGKNRELRRLFAACGHEVTRLKRIAFGGISLGTLRAGAFRVLSPEELAAALPSAPVLDRSRATRRT